MKRWASSGEYGGKRHHSGGRSDESDSRGSDEEEGHKKHKKHHRGFEHSGGRSEESGSMEERHHRKHHRFGGKCEHGHRHLFWRHAWGHKKHHKRHHGGRSGERSESRSEESGSRSFEHEGGKHHRKHGGHGRHRGHGRHGGHRGHRQECPAWQPWQQSKCLWPTQDYSSIPDACKHHEKHELIPEFLMEYKAAKAKEMYDIIQTLFKNRGANKACGYCSRKIQCRVREESEKMHFGCKPKEFKMVDEECEGTEACQLSLVLGGCPAPVPQKHLEELEHHKTMGHKKGHHFGQHGQFHHYKEHWGHHHGGSGEEHSGEHKRRRHHGSGSSEGSSEEGHRGPRSAQEDDDMDGGSKHSGGRSNETAPTKGGSSQEKVAPGSGSGSASQETGSHSGSAESGEHQWGGHHKNHTALPLWHCVKSKDGSKCLCCCGDYFPDVGSGLCKKVKFGAKIPVIDLWGLTSGGMPTGEHKE